MKRRRPPSGGSSRNTDYYVKKFRPSKSGGTSIESYFKSVSSSDKIDHPKDRSSTMNNKETNESITPQPSTSSNAEISVVVDTEDAIDPTEVSTLKTVNEVIEENPPVLESMSEDECEINEIDNDVDNTEGNKNVIDQRYITTYEKAYNWLYYSHSAAGFLCKVCSMLNNTGFDKPWETIAVDIKKKGSP